MIEVNEKPFIDREMTYVIKGVALTRSDKKTRRETATRRCKEKV